MWRVTDRLRHGRSRLGADGAATLPLLQAVLVSDIEGFTSLTGQLGDAVAADLLAQHDSIIDSVLEETGGKLEGRTGDGVVATFGSATSAVDCAVIVHRQVAILNGRHPAGSLHLRIGVAAGEPLHVDGALFGCVVQLAARLCRAAAPGHILVSNAVRELGIGKPDRFQTPQVVELKGFPDPVQAWEVRWHSEKGFRHKSDRYGAA